MNIFDEILGAVAFLLLLVGAFLALTFSVPAHAVNLELGLSKSDMSVAGDNIWYDAGYAHRNDLQPLGAIVGASGDVNRWLGWRFWAMYLGRPINSAEWPDDPDYFKHNGAKPIFRGEGSGEAYGISVAPVIFYGLGKWRIEAEAGALIYSARWREQIQTMQGEPWNYYSRGWHTDYTPYFGLTTHYGPIFVSYRKYRDVYAVDSVFGNALKQYVIGYSWSF